MKELKKTLALTNDFCTTMKEKITKESQNNQKKTVTEERVDKVKDDLIYEINSQPNELVSNDEIEKIIESSGPNNENETQQIKQEFGLTEKITKINQELSDLKNETLKKISELESSNGKNKDELILDKIQSLDEAYKKLTALQSEKDNINNLVYFENERNVKIIKNSNEVSLLETRCQIMKLEKDITDSMPTKKLVEYQEKYMDKRRANSQSPRELAQRNTYKEEKINRFNETIDQLNETLKKNNPDLTIELLFSDQDLIADLNNKEQYQQLISSLNNLYSEIKSNGPDIALDLINYVKDTSIKKILLEDCINNKDTDRQLVIDTAKRNGLLDDEKINNELLKRIEIDKEKTLPSLPINEVVDILKNKNSLLDRSNYHSLQAELENKFNQEIKELVEKNRIKEAVELADNLRQFANKDMIYYGASMPKSLLFCTNYLHADELGDLSQKEIDEIDETLSYLINSQNKFIGNYDFKNYLQKTNRTKVTDIKSIDLASYDNYYLKSTDSVEEFEQYLKETERSKEDFLKNISLDDKNIEKIFDFFSVNGDWGFLDLLTTKDLDSLIKLDQHILKKIPEILWRYPSNLRLVESYLKNTHRQNLNQLDGFNQQEMDKVCLNNIYSQEYLSEYLRLTQDRNINDIFHSSYFSELINSEKARQLIFLPKLIKELKPGPNSKLIEESLTNQLFVADNYHVYNCLSSIQAYLENINVKNIRQLPSINFEYFKNNLFANSNILLKGVFATNNLDLFIKVSGLSAEEIFKEINIDDIKSTPEAINAILRNDKMMDLFIQQLLDKKINQAENNTNKTEAENQYKQTELYENKNTEEQKIASLKNIHDCLKAGTYPEKLPALIFDKIKSFENKYGNKGKGLIALAIAAHGTDNPKRFCAEMEKIEKIIDQYNPNDIPQGAHVSLGFEYEVTKSIADNYNETSYLGYKNDINIISQYANIGRGNDAVHEIANKPTFNPYLLLAEAKLMQDAGLFDLNFTKHPQAARGYHLSLVGETGLKKDENIYFLNNLLTMTNYTGINAGTNINSTKDIYSKTGERLFENNIEEKSTNRMEIKGMACDRIEQFEKAILSAHNAGIAIQIVNKYLDPDLILANLNEPNFPKTAEELELKFSKNQLLTQPFESAKERKIFFEWLKLVNEINLAIDNHNENFIDSEFNGYCIKNGEYIETQSPYNIERNRKLVDEEKLRDPDFMNPINLNKNDLYDTQKSRFINSLSQINNIFLKGPQLNNNSSVNAGAVLETMKSLNGDEIMEGSPKKSIFDNDGQNRDGYYYIQGASTEMIAHKSQILLTEFNNNIQAILKEKEIALTSEPEYEYTNNNIWNKILKSFKK